MKVKIVHTFHFHVCLTTRNTRETPKLWKAWGSSLGAANSCVTRHIPPGGLKIFICEMGDEDGETRGSVRSVGELLKIFFPLEDASNQ